MKRIFLVEDNDDSRELVCALLDGFYSIEAYSDSLEALERLQSADDPLPDILLLDISLPNMDGTQLLLRVRSNPKIAHIPAIALTAHAMKDDESRFIGSGFDGYMSKPIVDETILIEKIEALIAAKH